MAQFKKKEDYPQPETVAETPATPAAEPVVQAEPDPDSPEARRARAAADKQADEAVYAARVAATKPAPLDRTQYDEIGNPLPGPANPSITLPHRPERVATERYDRGWKNIEREEGQGVAPKHLKPQPGTIDKGWTPKVNDPLTQAQPAPELVFSTTLFAPCPICGEQIRNINLSYHITEVGQDLCVIDFQRTIAAGRNPVAVRNALERQEQARQERE